jgi:hypothetical protein
MTEQWWLTRAAPNRMLKYLRAGGLSERKDILFGAACCRRILHLVGTWGPRALEAVERFAEAPGDRPDLRAALSDAVFQAGKLLTETSMAGERLPKGAEGERPLLLARHLAATAFCYFPNVRLNPVAVYAWSAHVTQPGGQAAGGSRSPRPPSSATSPATRSVPSPPPPPGRRPSWWPWPRRPTTSGSCPRACWTPHALRCWLTPLRRPAATRRTCWGTSAGLALTSAAAGPWTSCWASPGRGTGPAPPHDVKRAGAYVASAPASRPGACPRGPGGHLTPVCTRPARSRLPPAGLGASSWGRPRE